MLFLIQQNIHTKLDALRGQSAQDLAFWRALTWIMVSSLILGGCWLAYQWLLSRRAADSDRRDELGSQKRKNVEADSEPKIESPENIGPREFMVDGHADAFPVLQEVIGGTRVALFWDVGGLRCGSLGLTVGEEAGELIAAFDSDSTPTDGEAILLCPETAGHVLYYRVRAKRGTGTRRRRLSVYGPKPVSRIHHKCRAATNLRAAAIRPDASGGALLLRIQDLAFDGFGVLSEAELTPGDELEIQVELTDYLEPLLLTGRVAWAHVDPVGLWRGGIELAHENVEQRLVLADYILSTIRAESSEVVLEKRRQELTPVKPMPVEPIPVEPES